MLNARNTTLALLVFFVTTTLFADARMLDGANIVNSGSTNTRGWQIKFRSDGNGVANAAGSEPSPFPARTFIAPSSLVVQFFRDVEAARVANPAGRGCMKSASFGTRLTVTYHGWTSPDLSCPGQSPLLAELAGDVDSLVNIAHPPSGLLRVHMPLEPHVAPSGKP